MTVLEMELQGSHCSFMGPGTHPQLMAPALINRAKDFGEHEKTLPFQQPPEMYTVVAHIPIHHKTPHL